MSIARTIPLALAALSLASAAMAQGAPNATTFTVRVENISQGEALKLSTGRTAPFVSAPTFWVLHTSAANPIFTGGRPESGNGLEQLAETGNPEGLLKYVSAESGVAGVGAAARVHRRDGRRASHPGAGVRVRDLRDTRPVAVARLDVRSVERPVLLQRASDRALRRRTARPWRRDDAALAVGRRDRGQRGAGAGPEPGAAPEVSGRGRAPSSRPSPTCATGSPIPRTTQVLRLSITPSDGALSSSALGSVHAAPTVTACTSTSS